MKTIKNLTRCRLNSCKYCKVVYFKVNLSKVSIQWNKDKKQWQLNFWPYVFVSVLVLKAANFHVLGNWFELNVSYSHTNTWGNTYPESFFVGWCWWGGGGGVVFQLALFEWDWAVTEMAMVSLFNSKLRVLLLGLDLFTVVQSSDPLITLVNSQLVCLRPVGILNPVMFDLNYLFRSFARPL